MEETCYYWDFSENHWLLLAWKLTRSKMIKVDLFLLPILLIGKWDVIKKYLNWNFRLKNLNLKIIQMRIYTQLQNLYDKMIFFSWLFKCLDEISANECQLSIFLDLHPLYLPHLALCNFFLIPKVNILL